MEQSIANKIFVVTGATSGIGFAITEQLAAQGAAVIGVGRSTERCRSSEARLTTKYPLAEIRYLTADLSLQSDVRALAYAIRVLLAESGKTHLDGLINNAGTFSYWFSLTSEGIETQWAVNHLAPFLLTHELLELLQSAPSARIITVSSDSHYTGRIHWDDPLLRRSYNGLRAYEQSKLANVLFTFELNNRLGFESTVRAYAADPGLVQTEIGFKGTPPIVRWFWSLRRSAGITAAESAAGIVRLLTASEPTQDQTNIYWKHGRPRQPNRSALDRTSALRLWNLSSQMCGTDGGVQ